MSVVDRTLALSSLSATSELRAAFQRDEEVDVENRRSFVAKMTEPPNGEGMGESADETAILEGVSEATRSEGRHQKRAIEGGVDHFVKVYRLCAGGASSKASGPTTITRQLTKNASAHLMNVYTAELVVDASILDCVGWEFLKCSRQRTQFGFNNDGSVERRENVISGRHRESTEVFLNPPKGSGLTEMLVVSASVWTSSGSSRYIVAERESVSANLRLRRSNYDVTIKSLKMSETTFEAEEQLAGSIPLTQITMRYKVGSGGASGASEEEQALAATMHLSEMRKYFDKSLEIDRRRREQFCAIVKEGKEIYSDSEEKTLDDGMKMFSIFEGQRAKTIALSLPKTKGKMAFVQGDNRAWGWASGFVRANAIEVLAHLQDFKKRAGMQADDVEATVDEMPNIHNRLLYNWKRTPKIIADRDFLGRAIWRVKKGGCEFVTTPEENNVRRPHLPGVVRGKYLSAMKITVIGNRKQRGEDRVRHSP